MESRPSRLVVSLARWALMAGLAGLVLSALAFLDLVRGSSGEGHRALFLMAAILLSLAFVFVPFVRRAFGALPAARSRNERKTLLDEMRDGPDGQSEAAVTPSISAPPPAGTVLARVIVVIYLVFGAVLLAVLAALD